MGSWNKTCGLSRLFIQEGEPVYIFLLEENTRKGEDCYATGLYHPLLLPFEGIYDDYGSANKCFGPCLKITMDNLRDELVEMPLGENKYHDIAVSKKGFSIKKFFEAVHEHRLFIEKGFQLFVKYLPIVARLYTL